VHVTSPIAIVYSPRGDVFATAGTDGKARIWDARSGALRATLAGHTGWIEWVAFNPDGRRLVTGSSDGTARVWDARLGTPVACPVRAQRACLHCRVQP
jgi:WD40 repeat protein